MSAPTILYQFPRVQDALLKSKDRFDAALLRYDAWFLVLVAVILTMGAVLLAGMAAWCFFARNMNFTGSWEFRNWGIHVNIECK